MELLYEESAQTIDYISAKRKFNIVKAFSVISYVIAAIWLVIVWYFFDWNAGGGIVFNIIVAFLPPAIFIVGGILLGKYKNRFYVDYDYIFISGTVQIAKIFNQSKRKEVLSFETREIEKIGMYASNTYEKYENFPGIVNSILTSNSTPADNKDFYYMVVNSQGYKYLLVFECTETFIVNILKFAKKNVLEQEFLK